MSKAATFVLLMILLIGTIRGLTMLIGGAAEAVPKAARMPM